MSGRVVGRVHERILGSAARKAVLLSLADHANPDGEMSFPSVNRIAQETEFGESTVRECLAWLRNARLITQTAPPCQHRPATYRVDLEVLAGLQLVEVYRPGLQQPASRPPAGGARPPAGGPEPYLTVSEPSGERKKAEPPIRGGRSLNPNRRAVLFHEFPREDERELPY
jgi:hypothetical protein